VIGDVFDTERGERLPFVSANEVGRATPNDDPCQSKKKRGSLSE